MKDRVCSLVDAVADRVVPTAAKRSERRPRGAKSGRDRVYNSPTEIDRHETKRKGRQNRDFDRQMRAIVHPGHNDINALSVTTPQGGGENTLKPLKTLNFSPFR